MEIPYGFDCYAFKDHEIKYFESNILGVKSANLVPYNRNYSTSENAHRGYLDPVSGKQLASYVRFTRKNEYYSSEQLNALTQAGRLNASEIGKQIFCGIKIQIGIGVVTNFMRMGLQYRRPNPGWSELINGSWTGIVSGLTVDRDAINSYDFAFGNFLAYDEEFPYMKFGPFFAVESKLVMLTGSSRRIEASSFGTNIRSEIYLTITILLLVLSILASFRVHWQHTKRRALDTAIEQLVARQELGDRDLGRPSHEASHQGSGESGLFYMAQNFFFIYLTMLLNKPSLEFDDYVWPQHRDAIHKHKRPATHLAKDANRIRKLLEGHEHLQRHYDSMIARNKTRKPLPTSIRIVSYLWSAASFIMASIYSGEMLAVILLHADQNIDTVAQLINSKPFIEPVIRQDDFTYNLMLKSLDKNLLTLHNLTKIIPRPEVYSRRFIERVSQRKQALLGDDELIETIYDIYHKYFPLYKSKITYLQYPISVMYRKDLNATLEEQLRRGLVQLFEMGLIHRWYQAQKETYIKFYDTYEKKVDPSEIGLAEEAAASSSNQKYKPLSVQHFASFYKLMFFCILFALLVLILEIVHHRLTGHFNKM